jgi:hypothetical protein
MLARLGQLPLARGPAPGARPGGGPSPAPEARVLWVLALASLLASALFAAAAVLVAAVGQCVALRLRRAFRQRPVHLLIWAPAVAVAVLDFLKLVVLQVGGFSWECARAPCPPGPLILVENSG